MGLDLDRDGRGLFEGAARQGPERPEGRHHPRGRTLWHRRRQGHRRRGGRGRLPSGRQRSLLGLVPGSVFARHQAQARSARRDLPHRLQSGHHPVPAPGARARPQIFDQSATGAGYGVYPKLKETVGSDANYFYNVDPISIWQTNPKSLKPELLPIIKEVGDAYVKAKPDTVMKSAHVGMAASNTYAF